MLFPTKTSREHGVSPTGVHSSTKRFTPTRSGVWGCSRVPTSIELPKWPPTRAPWFDGVLPSAGDAFDCKDRGENSRSRGCLESLSGSTGSNSVRGTRETGGQPLFRGRLTSLSGLNIVAWGAPRRPVYSRPECVVFGAVLPADRCSSGQLTEMCGLVDAPKRLDTG